MQDEINSQIKSSFLKRFWWIGAIVIAVFGASLIFLNTRNRNDNKNNQGGGQINRALEQQQIDKYKKEHEEKDAKPTEDKTVETPVASNKTPLLKNLAVDFAPYDSRSGKAGAFKFIKSEEKVLYEFGAEVSGSDGNKMLPTFEYRVDPSANVYVASDGYIDRVKYQEDTKDYEIVIMAEKTSPWGIVYDHIKNVAVKEKDSATAGQKLGNPGTWGNGLGRTEIQVVKFDGESRTTYDYCPFKYFDPALIEQFKQKVATLMSDWETFKNDTGIYDQAKDVFPGCPYESLYETESGGVQVPK